ncbi:transposase, partial [Streptomyces sp. NPDC001984]
VPAGRLPQRCLRPQAPAGGTSRSKTGGEFPGRIRTYLWGHHFWSPSYFAASCGGAPLSIIKEYTENQKRPG